VTEPSLAAPDGLEDAVLPAEAQAVTAYIDGRFDELEERLGGQLKLALDNLESQLLTLPDIIDQSVSSYLAARLPQSPGPLPDNGHLGTAPDTFGQDQGAGQPGGAASSGAARLANTPLGAIFQQVDPAKMLEAWIKSRGDGDINTAIVRWLTGAGKKPAPPKVDTKYFSRGVGHSISMLRMKGVDPETQALSIKAQADQMLGEAGLLPDQRGYWDGIRAGAQSILDAHALTRQVEAAAQQPPAAPAPSGETGQ